MGLTKLYRKFVSKNIRDYIYELFLKRLLEYKRNYKLANKVIDYYKTAGETNKEQYIKYLQQHKRFLSNIKIVYQSDFLTKHLSKKIKVYKCKECGLFYVIHNGKKLYWKRCRFRKTVRRSYLAIIAEQDAQSPHIYWENNLDYKNKIMFDIGAAEGLITLDKINELKGAYLFECEDIWIEALQKTFEPYKDKVTIIKKYVADKNDEKANTITIDKFVEQTNVVPNLMKMDVEGFEEKVLAGAKQTISEASDFKVAVCVYHRADAEKNITDFFNSLGYKCKANDGYMYYIYDNEKPYLRHGVIKASK